MSINLNSTLVSISTKIETLLTEVRNSFKKISEHLYANNYARTKYKFDIKEILHLPSKR